MFLNIKYQKAKDYRLKLKNYNSYLRGGLKNIISLKDIKFKNKKDKYLNNNFVNKIIWYNYLKNKKYLRLKLRSLAIKKILFNIRKIKKRTNWKYNKFWIIRKKGIQIRKQKKIRLFFNTNVESNYYKSSYTIISKEFLNTPKFLKSKPLAFSLKINKFIKHFF